MEVFGKSMVAGTTNVIFLSTILGRDGAIPCHKCDWTCQNEHVCGNIYLCKLTGITHICDKNCNQRILYDNHTSLCRVSGQLFPLSSAEEHAVRGVRRKLEVDADSCAFKRRRDAHSHPSPFERSFSAVAPICTQFGGDAMDMRDKIKTSPRNRSVSLSTRGVLPVEHSLPLNGKDDIACFCLHSSWSLGRNGEAFIAWELGDFEWIDVPVFIIAVATNYSFCTTTNGNCSSATLSKIQELKEAISLMIFPTFVV